MSDLLTPTARGMLTAAGHALEYVWHGPPPGEAPTLVLLHEGLGAAGLWRDFPAKLAAATGCGALVYSRAGYGGSDPVLPPWSLDYMQDEALQVLPAVLAAAGVGAHILVGHSDGASIALINAGGAPQPGLLGVVAEAPHVFTEAMGLRSIAKTAVAFEHGDLADKLRRLHGANTDNVFWGWYRVWTDPDFRAWNIERYLPGITVPCLVIQGEDDEYGTVAQVGAVARQAGAGAEVHMLPQCGHNPHRDQAARTLQLMQAFIRRLLTV